MAKEYMWQVTEKSDGSIYNKTFGELGGKELSAKITALEKKVASLEKKLKKADK